VRECLSYAKRRASEHQERLTDPLETGSLEDACIDQPTHPTVALERVRIVIEAADGREGPASVVLPLLDLALAIFNAGAEAVEIVAKAF
jgi:hypothetical protein